MSRVSHETRLLVFERDAWKCHYCGCTVLLLAGRYKNLRATVDHIVPKAKGGSNRAENLITACEPCNQAKGDGPWPGVNITKWRETIRADREALAARMRPLVGPVDVFE